MQACLWRAQSGGGAQQLESDILWHSGSLASWCVGLVRRSQVGAYRSWRTAYVRGKVEQQPVAGMDDATTATHQRYVFKNRKTVCLPNMRPHGKDSYFNGRESVPRIYPKHFDLDKAPQVHNMVPEEWKYGRGKYGSTEATGESEHALVGGAPDGGDTHGGAPPSESIQYLEQF